MHLHQAQQTVVLLPLPDFRHNGQLKIYITDYAALVQSRFRSC